MCFHHIEIHLCESSLFFFLIQLSNSKFLINHLKKYTVFCFNICIIFYCNYIFISSLPFIKKIMQKTFNCRPSKWHYALMHAVNISNKIHACKNENKIKLFVSPKSKYLRIALFIYLFYILTFFYFSITSLFNLCSKIVFYPTFFKKMKYVLISYESAFFLFCNVQLKSNRELQYLKLLFSL